MADQILGGRYRIQRHLATGGMAEVYLAHDQLLDRPVAVKVLFPELARDPTFVERFRREAQAAARLNHPNIVSVYDFGQDGAAFYIVMEYVEGRPLSAIIRAEAPMAPERAAAIAAEVAAGLEAAHREGIIHRDVKPANVLVTDDGMVKVADFGIARATDARMDLTMPGMVIGTATYLSPEQAQGAAVDQRSDVYSLGLVLYEMLTGQAPFRGDNLNAVAYKQLNEVPPPPSSINPAVSPALDAAVLRSITYDAAGRPPSAAAFRSEVLTAASGGAAAMPPPTVIDPAQAATSVLLPPEAGGPVGAGVAAGAAAGAVAGVGATEMLPPGARVASRGVVRGPIGTLEPTPEETYRRRRLVALAVVLVLIAALVVAAALVSSNKGGQTTVTTRPATTVATTTTSTTTPPTTVRVAPSTVATTLPPTTVPPTTLPPTTVPPTTVPPTTVPATTTRPTTPITLPVTTPTS
ncbi:MAG TPA: protein kinase [Acidimicrobiales bacterium]|nr:protein kinase [Acidimicrobiales bacterium]